MANIYRCDKCQEIIEEDEARIYSTFQDFSEVRMVGEEGAEVPVRSNEFKEVHLHNECASELEDVFNGINS